MTLAATVCRGLFQGYGVEDIAVREGIPLDDVRAEVERARQEGRLPWIVAHARRMHVQSRQKEGGSNA